MKIAISKYSQPGETRVALTPAVAAKLVAGGVEVSIEPGAGAAAHNEDQAYQDAGATVSGDVCSEADVIVVVDMPNDQQVEQMRRGQVLIGMLEPLSHLAAINALAQQGVTCFAMEFLPRISRAQSMDVLSSQANIAGYKAVLLAADAGSKIYPMMMTAAGTIAPSRVFVIGAGVAGLQAIATAKRLGAIVEAFDVRPVVKEQVQSLGARFVELALQTKDAQTEDGYAREQSDEQRQQQSQLMTKHVIGADAVITTAAVFGKAPPMLIPNDVVEQMSPGSVLVDYAADHAAGRGNCQATRPGERFTTERGVHIIGDTNLPALVPVHASQAYANNMHAFLKEIIVEGQVKLDFEDEIQQGAAITHDGQVVNELVRQAIE